MPVNRLITSKGVPDRSGAPSSLEGPHGTAPLFHALLWPNRSLSRRGFVVFVGLTAALLTLPLLPALGSKVLWALLPFLLLPLAAVWFAIERSYRDGRMHEELTLWADTIRVIHHPARGAPREWQANPHWVRMIRYDKSGPVPDYLTLTGAGRTIELGAFLSPEERVALYDDLRPYLLGAGGIRK